MRAMLSERGLRARAGHPHSVPAQIDVGHGGVVPMRKDGQQAGAMGLDKCRTALAEHRA